MRAQPPSARALADVALACAARGWPVFPLRPRGKQPARGFTNWEGNATTDPGKIRPYWTYAPYNVGIACGPARLVVLDLDKPKPGEAPPPEWAGQPGIGDGADVLAALCEKAGRPFPFDTLTVSTRRGGIHLYFTAPPGLRLGNTNGRHRNGLGWLIDTRAHGGYVVAPGSYAALRDGTGPYAVIHDVPPVPLPEWLCERLSALQAAPLSGVHPHSRNAVSDRSAYIRAALQREGARVTAAPPGSRNHTLNKAAYHLGRLIGAGLLDHDTAHATLYTAAAHHFDGPDPLTPKEAADTIHSGLTAGARNPRHLARRQEAS